MPLAYERDDRRRLITVTVTDPYSVEDILGVIDRQAAEGTWAYAMFYDLRGAAGFPVEADLPRLADRVKAAGEGRERGPLGAAVGTRPERFRLGQQYTELTREIVNVEILLTAAQVDNWLSRNTRSSSPHL